MLFEQGVGALVNPRAIVSRARSLFQPEIFAATTMTTTDIPHHTESPLHYIPRYHTSSTHTTNLGTSPFRLLDLFAWSAMRAVGGRKGGTLSRGEWSKVAERALRTFFFKKKLHIGRILAFSSETHAVLCSSCYRRKGYCCYVAAVTWIG